MLQLRRPGAAPGLSGGAYSRGSRPGQGASPSPVQVTTSCYQLRLVINSMSRHRACLPLPHLADHRRSSLWSCGYHRDLNSDFSKDSEDGDGTSSGKSSMKIFKFSQFVLGFSETVRNMMTEMMRNRGLNFS